MVVASVPMLVVACRSVGMIVTGLGSLGRGRAFFDDYYLLAKWEFY